MGMDVIGTNPTAEVGSYFCRNIHGWAPLAALCSTYAPEETAPLPPKEWHYNEGGGLDGEHSILLAKRLRELIADGTVSRLVHEYRDYVDYLGRVGLGLDQADVVEFATFLESCGGFKIW
jgi:hypothetical protein